MQNTKCAKKLNKSTSSLSMGGNKVYTGPRGGKYIFVYCNKNKKKEICEIIYEIKLFCSLIHQYLF